MKLHPITVIEVSIFVVIIIILFAIAMIVPNRLRKVSLIIASSLIVILLSFFTIRPYWIDYQVTIKKELLNEYLAEKYPNEAWEFKQRIGREFGPYHLEVIFKNEKGWVYTYSVVNEKNICQSVWSPSGNQLPNEGKHYENIHCE